MADPVNFFGANRIFGAPPGLEDAMSSLPVHATDYEYISCWKFTAEELVHINRTGEVWLAVASTQHAPVAVSGIPRMKSQSPNNGAPLIYRSDGMHMVPEAMEYAIEKHGDQAYGPHKHDYHLGQVVNILAAYGYGWVYQSSGWLHDVVEDTESEKTPEERLATITDRFGSTVSGLVWAVTGVKFIDGVKQNRKACNAQMYVKIAELPEAAPLKGADRIANMEACLTFDDASKASMYLKEFDEFMENVGPHLPDAMVDHLFDTRVKLWEHFPKLDTRNKKS